LSFVVVRAEQGLTRKTFLALPVEETLVQRLRNGFFAKVFLDGSMRCSDNKEPKKATVYLVSIAW
jgi:tagatose-1,6-bisphosphate aldolase non-catalytic subunit AgaZ/GatZ